MHALIMKIENDREFCWTGDEWVSTSVAGWREAASFVDHDAASLELEQHEDEDEFRDAMVIDVDG